MKREELVARINKAATLDEQIQAVASLDAFDAQSRREHQQERDLDWADTTIKQTLQPVAVHERSTLDTDWLATTANADFDANHITAEAAMWYRRVSDEVKSDPEEFKEQLRGMARREASAYGEHMPAAEQQFIDYAQFLLRREAASGLDQVQQTVDSFENPDPKPLPEEVFDNFASPVHPVNEGVVGTETSERNPLIQHVMQNDGGGEQPPTHHNTAPVPYSYAEVPPVPAEQMQAASSKQGPDCELDPDGVCETHGVYHDSKTSSLVGTPSVAVSHVGNLNEVLQAIAAEEEKNKSFAPEDFDQTSFETTEHSSTDQPRSTHEAASGLDQVQQVVDSFENPDPKGLPQDVAYPWLLDEDEQAKHEQRSNTTKGDVGATVSKREAIQRRAAYVAGLLQKHPDDITPREAREIRSFTATLNKSADQWAVPSNPTAQPNIANSPATTPEPSSGTYQQGYQEGRSDFPTEAPTYADASSHAPDFVQGHSQGYSDEASGYQSNGQMPPGAGGREQGYQTHTGSRKTANGEQKCWSCGEDGYDTPATTSDDNGPLCEGCADRRKEDGHMASRRTAALRVSAAFTSPIEHSDTDFAKAYKYASGWDKTKPLVSKGSASFEAGLYAGISDNPQSQKDWTTLHRAMAKRGGKREYLKRLKAHREFSDKVVSSVQGMKVQGCYLKPKQASGDGYRLETGTRYDPDTNPTMSGTSFVTPDAPPWAHEGEWQDGYRDAVGHYARGTTHMRDDTDNDYWSKAHPDYQHGYDTAWGHARQANPGGNENDTGKSASRRKTAATSTDLDTMMDGTSPGPDGSTFINGPGQRPLMQGQGPANAPGGPGPYNAAPPYGQPVVPTDPTANEKAGSGYVDGRPGGPVDHAVLQRQNNDRLAVFKRTVASNLAKRGN